MSETIDRLKARVQRLELRLRRHQWIGGAAAVLAAPLVGAAFLPEGMIVYKESLVQRNGHRIYVRDHPGAAPPVILMHGPAQHLGTELRAAAPSPPWDAAPALWPCGERGPAMPPTAPVVRRPGADDRSGAAA